MSETDEAWKNHKQPEGYEAKFAEFIGMIAHAKAKKIPKVLVAYPWVLGDTYDEIIESLSRLAEADLRLQVADRYDHQKTIKPRASA